MQISKIDQLMLRLLSNVTLFDGLDRKEMMALLGLMSKVQLSPDQRVFNEGERGESLLILISGQLEVFRFGTQGEEVRLALLNPGAVVGEIALIESTSRSASVRALSDCMALGLAQSSIVLHPGLAAKVYRNLARILAQRLRISNDDKLRTTTTSLLDELN